MSTSYPLRLTSASSLSRPYRQTAWTGVSDKADAWQKTAIFLVIGYLLFNRSFAYLGIPQLKLFIGEIVLFCFLVFRRVEGLDTFFSSLASPVGRLHDCAWAMFLFIGYGLFETIRGVVLGYPVVICIENFAFNYYALYLLLGWWLGQRNPRLLKTIVIRLAWLNGFYGIAFILFLSRVPIAIPGNQGDPAGLFGQPWGAALSLLGLMCYERNLERVALPLSLNAFVLLGMQVRAEWIGFLTGLIFYALLTKQIKRVLLGQPVCALLTVGYAANITLPGAGSRAGGVISTREIAARAIAPFDEDTAALMTDNARTYQETATWRTNWWKAIWASVHEDAEHAAIGNGYGYPLVDLVPYLKGRYWLRTPHSIFFYALGYGGWFHVLLLLFLEATMARLLWQSFCITRQPFGLVAWAVTTAWVFFDSAFESPFRAIPFFLITGIAMAPAMKRRLVLE